MIQFPPYGFLVANNTSANSGYGDIVPHTIPSRWVVICVIVVSWHLVIPGGFDEVPSELRADCNNYNRKVALAVLPGLISNLLDALKFERAGGGTFEKGSHPFVVLVGVFDNAARIKDVLTAFYERQEEKATAYRLVFLSREPATATAQVLLADAQYKEKVTFLVGRALVDPFDMKRAGSYSLSRVPLSTFNY